MNTEEVIQRATLHLVNLQDKVFDVVNIGRPVSAAAAVDLAKVVSKVSPLVGNQIEFNTTAMLNQRPEFRPFGRWIRQDPDFPDVVFEGKVAPRPGFEIKAWFPLAT